MSAKSRKFWYVYRDSAGPYIPIPGGGNTVEFRREFLALPGQWSDDPGDVMKFPHAAMAQSHARRHGGLLAEGME